MADKTVLLVEDDPDEAELTIRVFRKQGLANLVVAHDGAEALDYLFGNGRGEEKAMPQVILLDLKLPKVGGLEVLRRLREDDRTKSIPVVILTSSQEDEDLMRGLDLGTNIFFRKPVDPDLFSDVVQQMVQYWLLLA
ncbi:MAG: response regulator [Chloroflexi bacterium]|nr:response regulator [Chloroflexota bacterium]